MRRVRAYPCFSSRRTENRTNRAGSYAIRPREPPRGEPAARARRPDAPRGGALAPFVPGPADPLARLEDHDVRVAPGDLPGAVAAPAVDDDHLELRPRKGLRVELPQERLDPRLLVERRDDDGDLHPAAPSSSARAAARRMHWSVLM